MAAAPIFRQATEADLPAIVRLLADDTFGAAREETADLRPYTTLQLTFIRGLLHRGATRAQIEAVRVDRDARGKGVGEAFGALGW